MAAISKEEPKRIEAATLSLSCVVNRYLLMQTGKVEANLLALNQIFQIPRLDSLVDCKIRGSEQVTVKDTDLSFLPKNLVG
ncbi:MAG: hypothetical protein R2867_09040 [Caldilineaceae bacterium]